MELHVNPFDNPTTVISLKKAGNIPIVINSDKNNSESYCVITVPDNKNALIQSIVKTDNVHITTEVYSKTKLPSIFAHCKLPKPQLERDDECVILHAARSKAVNIPSDSELVNNTGCDDDGKQYHKIACIGPQIYKIICKNSCPNLILTQFSQSSQTVRRTRSMNDKFDESDNEVKKSESEISILEQVPPRNEVSPRNEVGRNEVPPKNEISPRNEVPRRNDVAHRNEIPLKNDVSPNSELMTKNEIVAKNEILLNDKMVINDETLIRKNTTVKLVNGNDMAPMIIMNDEDAKLIDENDDEAIKEYPDVIAKVVEERVESTQTEPIPTKDIAIDSREMKNEIEKYVTKYKRYRDIFEIGTITGNSLMWLEKPKRPKECRLLCPGRYICSGISDLALSCKMCDQRNCCYRNDLEQFGRNGNEYWPTNAYSFQFNRYPRSCCYRNNMYNYYNKANCYRSYNNVHCCVRTYSNHLSNYCYSYNSWGYS